MNTSQGPWFGSLVWAIISLVKDFLLGYDPHIVWGRKVRNRNDLESRRGRQSTDFFRSTECSWTYMSSADESITRGLSLFRSLNSLIWLFGTLYNLLRCELRRGFMHIFIFPFETLFIYLPTMYWNDRVYVPYSRDINSMF